MIRVLALIVCCFFTSAASFAGKPDDAAKKDLKALIGKYKVEKAELGGKDALDIYKGLTVEIAEGGKYIVVLGELKDFGKVALNPSKKPAEMDITGTEGPNKDKTIKAIYKLDGDTLTICYGLGGGGDRPTKFETKEGTMQFLAVYKREKK